MRILWSIHLYVPGHNCGSEYVAHHVNRYLTMKGHECRVILHMSKTNKVNTPYTYENVEVFGATGHVDSYRWADVICTHLDYTQFSIMMAHEAKRPLVHFVHNNIPYTSIQGSFSRTFVVYNSNWIADELNYNWPSMVLHPPCDVNYYDVDRTGAEAITLISLNENKGAGMFRQIAESMPERKFIGVVGSYDEQYRDMPSNVEVIENTPDILSVYKRTRILLMPSAYESWGRTATEAMCSGIPVICTPTPGLLENCGDAGIYVGSPLTNPEPGKPQVVRGRVQEWVAAIRALDDDNEYQKKSLLCRARASELKPEKELAELEDFLYRTQS